MHFVSIVVAAREPAEFLLRMETVRIDDVDDSRYVCVVLDAVSNVPHGCSVKSGDGCPLD